MDKKNRTGLQSKISHIFAGVPIPKKKTPGEEHSQSQNNDEITEVTLSSKEDIVIEEDIARPEETQPGIEDKAKDEFPANQRLEEDFSDEQFTVIEDEDVDLNTPKHLDKTEIKGHQEIKENDSGKPEVHVEKPEVTSFNHFLSPDKSVPESVTNRTQAQKPEKQESKDEKLPIEKKIPLPSVTEPAVEKPSQSPKHKIEIDNSKTLSTAGQSIGMIPGVEALKKRDLRSSPKISSKKSVKRLKLKPSADRNKQKVMIFLVAALSIALVLILGKQSELFSSNPGSSSPVGQTGINTIPTKNNTNLTIDWPMPPLYPDNLPDPMKPTTTTGGQTGKIVEHPDLDITGISGVQGGNYQVSIIGKELPYKAGDVIKDKSGRDVKILDVQNNQISFEMNSLVWIYYVNSKSWTRNQ